MTDSIPSKKLIGIPPCARCILATMENAMSNSHRTLPAAFDQTGLFTHDLAPAGKRENWLGFFILTKRPVRRVTAR